MSAAYSVIFNGYLSSGFLLLNLRRLLIFTVASDEVSHGSHTPFHVGWNLLPASFKSYQTVLLLRFFQGYSKNRKKLCNSTGCFLTS